LEQFAAIGTRSIRPQQVIKFCFSFLLSKESEKLCMWCNFDMLKLIAIFQLIKIINVFSGLGDDNMGYGVDGFSNLFWHNGGIAPAARDIKWSENSIVGVAIDVDSKSIRFSLDGEEVGQQTADSNWEAEGGLVIAISITKGESASINIGESPLRYQFQNNIEYFLLYRQ
jgi:hypothetical protein